MVKIAAFIALLFVSLSAQASNLVIPDGLDEVFDDFRFGAESTKCKMDGKRRFVVHIYALNPKKLPCQVRYYKPTEHPRSGGRILWHAHNSKGYCQRKANLLVKRLQRWGWSCRASKHFPNPACDDKNSGWHEHHRNPKC